MLPEPRTGTLARAGAVPAAIAAFVLVLTVGAGRAEPAPTGPKAADDLAQESETFVKRGMYANAMKKCEKALTVNDGHARALTACVIAACNLKLAAKARTYQSRLKAHPARHAQTRQICLRNSIDVD